MKLPDGRYSQHELKKLCISCRDHTIKEDPTETCCMFGVLSKEPDFLAQKPWLAETVERNPGCFIFWYPKYHCELNYIEMVWGWIKAHHRNNCKYNYPALKKGLPITLNELVPIAFVRGAFKTPNNKWVRVCHSKCGVWTRFRTRLLMKLKNGNT